MKYKKPIILGVLNVSPESYWKDSVGISKKDVLKRAIFLKNNGADYIDIGGRSTSVKAKKIDDNTEFKRLLPAIKLLKEKDYKISIDTWSANTAIKCLKQGVDIINYTSSNYTANLFRNLRKYNAGLIMTYMPHINAYKLRDSTSKLPTLKQSINYFKSNTKLANKRGFKKLILDPNVGIFNRKLRQKTNEYKRVTYQMYIIGNLHKFKQFKFPVLLSLAYRKDHGPAIIMMALYILKNNPDFIRTHDPDIINRLLSTKNV